MAATSLIDQVRSIKFDTFLTQIVINLKFEY